MHTYQDNAHSRVLARKHLKRGGGGGVVLRSKDICSFSDYVHQRYFASESGGSPPL